MQEHIISMHAMQCHAIASRLIERNSEQPAMTHAHLHNAVLVMHALHIYCMEYQGNSARAQSEGWANAPVQRVCLDNLVARLYSEGIESNY
jgi:hypothetical protein